MAPFDILDRRLRSFFYSRKFKLDIVETLFKVLSLFGLRILENRILRRIFGLKIIRMGNGEGFIMRVGSSGSYDDI